MGVQEKQCGIVAKNVNSGIKSPGFGSLTGYVDLGF